MAIPELFRLLYVNRFARRVVLSVLITSFLLGGIQLRRWTWAETRHVRFQHDLVNAFYWGSETLKEARRLSPDEASANSWTAFARGYFGLYDRVKRKAYDHDYRLDYPPLRLLAMSIWAKLVRSHFPEVDDGHPKHVKPLLNVNLFCELISAVAFFPPHPGRESRLDLRVGRGQRRMAGAINDSRRAWMAAMGRLGSAVFSVCGARRFNQALVLVW